eukprot:2181470-Amphidinium_carterae.1
MGQSIGHSTEGLSEPTPGFSGSGSSSNDRRRTEGIRDGTIREIEKMIEKVGADPNLGHDVEERGQEEMRQWKQRRSNIL